MEAARGKPLDLGVVPLGPRPPLRLPAAVELTVDPLGHAVQGVGQRPEQVFEARLKPGFAERGDQRIEDVGERALKFVGLGQRERTDVRLRFIEPGKPVQNAFVESLSGKLREECLNLHWFRSRRRAREEIERSRHHSNIERPHAVLAYRTPMQVLTTTAAAAHEPLAGSALPLTTQFKPDDSSSPRP